MKSEAIENLVLPTEDVEPAKLGKPCFGYVDISSIDRESKRITRLQRLNTKDAPSRARKLIRADDVLISTVRPNLNAVAQVPRQFDGEIASTGFCVLRPKHDALESSYLYYFTQSTRFVDELVKKSTGATYPAVSDGDVLDTLIPLPSRFADQHRIAGILERADRVRRLRRYALEVGDGFLPAAFLAMFGNPLTLMRRWERRPFGELLAADLRNGMSPSNAGLVMARVLTLSAITKGVFDGSESKLAPFNKAPGKDKRVSASDFLICRGNGNLGLVGIGTFSPNDMPDYVFPDTMIAAQVKPDAICARFLGTVWNSPALRRQIEASARTTNGTYKINQEVLAEIEIPVPPLSLQQQFAALVEKHERLRQVHREALRQAEHLFQTLLHRAFTTGL